MLRTQVQLTEEQDRMLSDLGRERRVAKSELVRQAVDLLLAGEGGSRSLEEQRERALAVAGRFRSGEKRTARDHDTALAETFSRPGSGD